MNSFWDLVTLYLGEELTKMAHSITITLYVLAVVGMTFVMLFNFFTKAFKDHRENDTPMKEAFKVSFKDNIWILIGMFLGIIVVLLMGEIFIPMIIKAVGAAG